MRTRAVVVAMLATTVLGVAPANAATKAHVVAHVTPATALVGSVASVTGSVSPAGKTPVVLERYVNKHWQTLASQKPQADKTFLFHVRVSASLVLRVVRAAAISGTLHLKGVKTAYRVTATLQGNVVTGAVKPKAKGSVQLQALVGKAWKTVASAKLSAKSTYTMTLTRPPGSYRLRVVKAFSSAVAAGSGKAFTLVVAAPPAAVPPPVVTTAAVPAGRVAVPYSATLAATGGTSPLTWTATALPAGLTVSPAGVLSGTPTTAGTAAVAVTVTDAAGRTESAVLSLTIAPRAGKLYGWGYDASGQVGNGVVSIYTTVPGPVVGMTSVTTVAAAPDNGYAVRSDGALFAWGNNSSGQLGAGHTSAASATPVQVSGIDSVTAVAGCGACVYALKADGTVWSWGANSSGELGNNTLDAGLVPAPVYDLASVVAIAAGEHTGYALKSDGTVWAWGDNADGEIGNATNSQNNFPAKVSNLTGVVAIAAGQETGYALKSDGTVWAWGYGAMGGLGNGANANSNVPVQVTGLSTAVAVAGGGNGGYALLANGTVWAWGSNVSGELGNGVATPMSLVPVQVHNLTGVLAISAGYAQGYAVLADGTAQAWGDDQLGGLGDGAPATHSALPTGVSGVTTSFLIVGSGSGETAFVLQAG